MRKYNKWMFHIRFDNVDESIALLRSYQKLMREDKCDETPTFYTSIFRVNHTSE